MNLEQDHTSSIDPEPDHVLPQRRRMRVRHSYPAPVIELVKHLFKRLSAREISDALDVPLSSIYRWCGEKIQRDTSCLDNIRSEEQLAELVMQCQRDGFRVPRSIEAKVTENIDDNYCVTEQAPTHPPQDSADPSSPIEAWIETDCNNVTGSDTKQRMEKVVHTIRNEYFREIGSRELARVAGLSRYHFIRTFSATHGISPHQYLLKVRMTAAKRLLQHSTETIDVVAAATGFRSGACLNRAFTRLEGHCISRACRIVKNAKP